MAIIPSRFLDAVVSIGVRQGTNTKWIGTGFFVLRKSNENGDGKPFLVTNKHVFKDKNLVVIRMKDKDSEAVKEIDAPLEDNGKTLYLQMGDTMVFHSYNACRADRFPRCEWQCNSL